MTLPPRTNPDTAPMPPRWQRWLPRVAALVAGFATLCCLGVTALVSLLTAIGATFLTTDATLKPLLAVSLLVTIVTSGLTWRRHRNPLPLLLTVLAAAVTFWSLYGTQLLGHHPNAHGDAMGDGMGGHTESAMLPGGIEVWVGLALLLIAQLWDVWRLRQLMCHNPVPSN